MSNRYYKICMCIIIKTNMTWIVTFCIKIIDISYQIKLANLYIYKNDNEQQYRIDLTLFIKI